LGIFNQFFTHHILHITIYAKLQYIYSIISNFYEVMPYKARQLVWCVMSEKCIKSKVFAKIDFIAFLASLGVK